MSEEQKLQDGTTQSLTPEQMNSTETTFDLVELMYRLLGSWKMIIGLAVLLAVLSGVLTVKFITPIYSATSTIYVLNNSDSVINLTDLQIGAQLTKDYIEVFMTWEVREQVISNLDLDYSYTELGNMVTISNPSNTRMLKIRVESADPEEAAAIANGYAEVASQYIADTMYTDKPSLISKALVPANPISPNRSKNILMGFMLGGLLGCTYVVIRMIMDDKYKTTDDILKHTGLTTLAIVPLEENAEKNKKTGRKPWITLRFEISRR